jgi:serine/threonine-protein kinase
MTELQTGARIAGRYELQSRLDAGGNAQVWAATDEELQRQVAIKILVTPEGGDPSFVDAFRAEAQAEAGLKHPGIVEVFDWGHEGNLNYIVMDLLAGRTVRDALMSTGPIAWEQVVSVGRQISSALAYAHHADIAHGHVSAERIVLGADGRATAIGFGLRCRGGCEIAASPDADTFALGGVLYEMLTGASPFGAAPAGHPANQPWPASPKQSVPGAPHELDRIVMKAISPDPAQRYHTAAELEADLDALAKPKSRAWLWWLLAVLAILFAAGVTWYFSSQQKVVVPDVAGKTQSEAATTLGNVGFKLVVSGQQASSTVPTGTVVSENPPAGTAVRKGADVAVVLSTGLPTVAMPSVSGVSLTAASAAIASAGLTVGTVTRQNSDTFPADTVISASQSSGAQVTQGTAVDLVVSAGQATASVPDVRGASQADATTKLSNAGFKVDVGQVFSSQSAGTVISQGPAAGSTVPAGSTVTISVSKGPAPVSVPDLASAKSNAAQSSLTELGLVPVVSTEASGTSPGQKGVVVSQDPEAGAKVAPGSKVTLTIGN